MKLKAIGLMLISFGVLASDHRVPQYEVVPFKDRLTNKVIDYRAGVGYVREFEGGLVAEKLIVMCSGDALIGNGYSDDRKTLAIYKTRNNDGKLVNPSDDYKAIMVKASFDNVIWKEPLVANNEPYGSAILRFFSTVKGSNILPQIKKSSLIKVEVPTYNRGNAIIRVKYNNARFKELLTELKIKCVRAGLKTNLDLD